MKLMTSQERQVLEQELVEMYSAADELAMEAVRAERAARTASMPSGAAMARARALAAVPQVARRLLKVQAELDEAEALAAAQAAEVLR